MHTFDGTMQTFGRTTTNNNTSSFGCINHHKQYSHAITASYRLCPHSTRRSQAGSPVGSLATPHDDPRSDRSALDPHVQRVEDRSGSGAWTRHIFDESHLC